MPRPSGSASSSAVNAGAVAARRPLAVDQHQAVGGTDLVGVDARFGRHVGDVARILRIADVDDGGAGRVVDVADIGVVAVDHDLSAAVAVEIADLTNAFALAHVPYSPPDGIGWCHLSPEFVHVNNGGRARTRHAMVGNDWALPGTTFLAPGCREPMVPVIRSLAAASSIVTVAAGGAFAAEAVDYPSRTVRIVVGFAAGGAPDALARIVGDRLGQAWRQPVVVENRTGAQGNLAMTAVAKAPPDGYTLALVPIGNAAVNPSLFDDLPYDIVKDFAPVTQIATVENVLVVGAQSPAKSLKELVALGRSAGANLTYATPGAGSLAHLAAELLARGAGFEMRHVPYRGVSPALTDVLRGEVTMMFAQLSTAKPFIDSGQLRALGVASKARSAVLPDVPTVAEGADLPEFEAVSWYALMAPARTPEPIVSKLHQEVARIVQLPEVKAAMEAQGAKPVGGTPAELAAVIAAGYRPLG